MKPSLREKIELYLQGKAPHFVSGDDIERFGQSQGAKASAARRRIQELAEKGIVERGETKDGYVQYRTKTAEIPIVGIVKDEQIIYRPDFIEKQKENQQFLFT